MILSVSAVVGSSTTSRASMSMGMPEAKAGFEAQEVGRIQTLCRRYEPEPADDGVAIVYANSGLIRHPSVIFLLNAAGPKSISASGGSHYRRPGDDSSETKSHQGRK